jgi:hypothetical protein
MDLKYGNANAINSVFMWSNAQVFDILIMKIHSFYILTIFLKYF